MRAGEFCPHCGRALLPYENPPRFLCEEHGVVKGEAVLRPDPSQPLLDPEEKIIKYKGRKYLHRERDER